MERLAAGGDIPPYFPELACLERTLRQVSEQETPTCPQEGPAVLNPTLELIACRWRNLPQLFSGQGDAAAVVQGEELVAVWQDPRGRVLLEPATPGDLVALKIVLERLAPEDVALETGRPVAHLDAALHQAARRGLILAPPSRLRRGPDRFGPRVEAPEQFGAARVFSLQWHLTQSCDLHCRHCYDRSSRSAPSLDAGLDVLRQLRDFCRSRHVSGRVAFTGGNPFLHTHFYDFYRAATEMGLGTVVLGNPVPEEKLEQLLAIGPPLFYQVSLEGLEGHNDEIRGPGNFRKVLSFLDTLRRFKVSSMVMLTLTRANLHQVLPLAQVLRGRAEDFHFNRLAQFGEGARLQLPGVEEYRAFLADYLEAARHHPVLGLKDNLFNILLEQRGLEKFGGCTGFGCGAAFSFLTLLSDGEVHACRKFPSLIGNLRTADLEEIYESSAARRYRRGSEACRGCSLHPVCGGCLALTAGLGGDPFHDRDPFCFKEHICRNTMLIPSLRWRKSRK